jgi:hypothetical protein
MWEELSIRTLSEMLPVGVTSGEVGGFGLQLPIKIISAVKRINSFINSILCLSEENIHQKIPTNSLTTQAILPLPKDRF